MKIGMFGVVFLLGLGFLCGYCGHAPISQKVDQADHAMTKAQESLSRK
jgi:hypothetical protein